MPAGCWPGLALTIRYLAGGRVELAEATPVSPGTLMGTGLGLAALTAAAPLLFGAQMFTSAAIEFTWPLFGEQKFVTSTIFDIGVYLVVVGLVIDVLRSLGSEIDDRSEGRSPTDTHDNGFRRGYGSGTLSTNITLLIVMGVLFAVGIYLLLERSLTRVLLGIVVLGNGVNLLILSAGGRRGAGPAVPVGAWPRRNTATRCRKR